MSSVLLPANLFLKLLTWKPAPEKTRSVGTEVNGGVRKNGMAFCKRGAAILLLSYQLNASLSGLLND